MQNESYFSEDVTWLRFNMVCSENMHLRDGFVLKLAWKFSDGQGSKEWITLHDEQSPGVRGPGTSDHMLRTLRSLVKFNWLLISNNILGTFQM